MKNLTFLFPFLMVVLFTINPLFAQMQIGSDLIGGGNEGIGESVAIAMDGNRIAYGGPLNYGSGVSGGVVRVFDLINGDWVQVGSDIEGEALSDRAGQSIALSEDGSRLVFGIPENDANGDDAGKVKAYDFVGNDWVQVGSDILGELEDEECGRTISLSSDGNRLVVGSPGYDAERGRVRIYNFENNEWVQLGGDLLGSPEDMFGDEVTISGDGTILAATAVMGDYFKVYSVSNTQWLQQGPAISEPFFAMLFASLSLSEDGSRLVVGASWSDEIRIYERPFGTNWQQVGASLLGQVSEDFGASVSISSNGNFLAVGIPANDNVANNAGAVKLYDLSDVNNWIQIGNDIPGDLGGDRFGTDVQFSSSGSRVVIGTPFSGIDYSGTGLVRVFGLGCVNTVETTETVVSCTPFTWIDGNTYTESNNIATVTLSDMAGCDSIVTLDLTISSVDVSVTEDSPTLMAVASGATYQWVDCNNDYAALTGETGQSFTASENGNYAVIVSENDCVDTSQCFTINTVNIEETYLTKEVKLYPNPTADVFRLELGEPLEDVQIKIVNTLGQTVYIKEFDQIEETEIYLKGKSGMYLVSILLGGKELRTIRLMRT